jgi:hypothetical protein
MSEDSKSFVPSTVRVLTLLVVILICLFAATNWFITSSDNKDFQNRYNEIEPGMPESAVVSLLGTPHKRSSEFYLGQREGFEEAYERAEKSGATRYLMWHRETDVVYAVGINAEGNVVIIEAGGT